MLKKTSDSSSPLMGPLLGMMKGGRLSSSSILTNPLVILTLTCLVCYLNTLSCGFVFDDISAIKDNKARFFNYRYNKVTRLNCVRYKIRIKR